MGWKNLKDHFKIDHIVQVVGGVIWIGSGYVSDLATIDPETGEVLENQTFRGFLRQQYPAMLEADAAEIVRLISEPDAFEKSLTVYTYDGGDIIEKQCEELGWPNVTHDGALMYQNSFSSDKATVVAWAKRDAEIGIRFAGESVKEAEKRLSDCCAYLERQKSNLAKLNALTEQSS